MKNLVVFSICLLFAFCFCQKAEAGVLLRSQRVTARVTYRPPRVKLPSGRKSTIVQRRLNPIGGRGGTIGGYESQISLAKANYKYKKKLYKWERKRQRAREKYLRKKKRAEEKRLRKLRKEEESRRRALEKKKRKLAKAQELEKTSEGTVRVSERSSEERGSLLDDDGKKKDKKKHDGTMPSFWSRLMKALVGA